MSMKARIRSASETVRLSYNKAFKSDSQRVAFLLCVAFSALGGLLRHWYCVAHTLMRRYYRNGSLMLNAKGCKLGVKQAG